MMGNTSHAKYCLVETQLYGEVDKVEKLLVKFDSFVLADLLLTVYTLNTPNKANDLTVELENIKDPLST
jgi:hypothetical protein